MKKYKIGYTMGIFDMFHVGHLNLLRRAKEQCDYLIVGVSTDEVAESYKHHQPIIPYEQRSTIVKAIRYVDEVVPQTTMDKIALLKQYHFDVMFQGDEWQDTELYNRYEEELGKYDSKIVYLSHTEGISSSMLRKEITLPRNVKIGYTQGTFDLFHVGHLNLIKHAKELCDYLIVGVNTDELVSEYKHKMPVIGENERAGVVSGLVYVDACSVVNTLDKMDAYGKYHFNTIFIGDDWKGNSRWEQTRIDMEKIGVDVVFLPHTNGISSSVLTETIKYELLDHTK